MNGMTYIIDTRSDRMTILIHKDIFEDISKFKEVCECVLENVKPKNLTMISDFKTMRFDEPFNDDIEYTIDNYIEIDSSDLENQLKFAIEIEKGNYPG